mgnify:CR=1 FL=1
MPWSTYGTDGQRKYLIRSETDRFLSTAKKEDIRHYTFCWLITATGCRISEALNITTKNFDFEAGLVIVESLKKRRTGVYRAIPLPVTLLEALSRFVKEAGLTNGARLWPWSRMTGYRRITDIMAKAGIVGPWATPKGLRHGFGVRAVQSGAPLHLVQRWLGHADMKTAAIYVGAEGPEEREIASRTWLDQDSAKTRARSAPDSPGTAFRHPDHSEPAPLPVTPMTSGIQTRDISDKIDKKPWFKRMFGSASTIFFLPHDTVLSIS